MPGRNYKFRCRECRRRKIKCSGEQPSCTRCTNNGLVCPGYEDKTLWIHQTTTDQEIRWNKTLKKANQSPNKAGNLPPGSVAGSSAGMQLLNPVAWEIGAGQPSSLTSFASSIPKSPNPSSLNLMQTVSTYLFHGRHKMSGVVPPEKAGINWVVTLPKRVSSDPVVDHALQALSTIHIGKVQKDENVIRLARLSYGRALRSLRAAAIRGQRDEKILSAVNALCLYELYDSPHARMGGFIKHVQGAQVLALGLVANSDMAPHGDAGTSRMNTYSLFRTMAIANSFGTRKACLLASKTIFDLIKADDYEPFRFDSLEEITIYLPALVELSDKLKRLPFTEKSNELYEQIFIGWQKLSELLNLWFKITWSPKAYWEDPSPADDPELDFGPSFVFASFWTGTALAHYFPARVLLYDALHQAVRWKIKHRSITTDADSTTNSAPFPTFLAAVEQIGWDTAITESISSNLTKCEKLIQECQDDAAKRCLKTIRYMFREEWGTMSLIFPSSTALYIGSQDFKKNKKWEEIERCDRVCKYLEKRGLVLGKFLQLNDGEWGDISDGKDVESGIRSPWMTPVDDF